MVAAWLQQLMQECTAHLLYQELLLIQPMSCAGEWLSNTAALPAPAASQGALWGASAPARPGTSLYSSSSADVSGASTAPSGVQHQTEQKPEAELQAPYQPSEAALTPTLAADPWAQDVSVPVGYNPWSIGFGGLQPHQQQQQQAGSPLRSTGSQLARGSSDRPLELAAPCQLISQLNPAAGEYMGSGPVLAPHAAAAVASSRVPLTSNIWGAQGLFGPPAASHAPQAPQWGAPAGSQHFEFSGTSAAESGPWAVSGAMRRPALATPGPLDWGQGASPPFSDAPLFLSSMMQQVSASSALHLLQALLEAAKYSLTQ